MAEEKKKKNKSGGAIIIGTILVAIIILLLVFSLQGKTTTTGNYPENVSDESLTCTATGIDHPIFTYDRATKKTAEINVLFSRDKLKSIALTYSLYYDSAQDIIGSEAHNHAAMNKSFAASGLGEADAYNAKYARMEDRMQMNLYTTASDFDDVAKKYFLIGEDAIKPESIAEFENTYKRAGFDCKSIKN